MRLLGESVVNTPVITFLFCANYRIYFSLTTPFDWERENIPETRGSFVQNFETCQIFATGDSSACGRRCDLDVAEGDLTMVALEHQRTGWRFLSRDPRSSDICHLYIFMNDLAIQCDLEKLGI